MNPEEIKRQKQQEGKRRNRIIIITILLLLFVLVIAGGVTPTLFNRFFNKAPLIPVSEVTKPTVPKVSTPKDEDEEILIPEETQIAAIDEAIAPIITPENPRIKPKFSPLKSKPLIVTPTPIINNPIPGSIIIPNTPEIPLPQPGEDILDTPEDEEDPDIDIASCNPFRSDATTFATTAGGEDYDFVYAVSSFTDGSTVTTGTLAGGKTSIFGDCEVNETILKDNDNNYKDLFIAKYNPNGSLAWAKRPSSTNDSEGMAVTALNDGSTVVTGDFAGNITFGEGEPNEITLSTTGSREIFITKYNNDGTLAWAKKTTGLAGVGYGITGLADGSTIVTGEFRLNTIFGEGEINETTLIFSGGTLYDMFIAKYNADGTLAWAKSAGAANTWQQGSSIASFSDESSVVTGWFEGSPIFGLGEANETTLSSIGNRDVFVAKYNSDGSLAWAKRAGGSGVSAAHYGWAISTLGDGSSVVTGEFYTQPITFGSGELNETTLTTTGSYDIFIAKYNADGTLAWAKKAGGPNTDFGYGIGVLTDESIIVTGNFRGPAVFGAGESNETTLNNAMGGGMFLAKYDTDGLLVWVHTVDATGDNYNDYYADNSILSIDANDNITVAGWLLGSVIFGSGDTGETRLTSLGFYSNNIFVTKYNSDGILTDSRATAPSSQPCITPPISNNLILYLDVCASSYSGTGTIWTDLSPSGNNGELFGPYEYNNKDGGSLLSRKERGVRVNLSATETIDTYTYNAWVRSLGDQYDAYIIDLGDTNTLHIDNNELALYAPDYSTGFNLEVGKWYNIAVTHTVGEDIKFYVNGELVYTTPDTNSDIFNVDFYNIGATFDDPITPSQWSSWSGNISHVSVYDRALDQTELQQFFDDTKLRFGDIGLVP